MADWAMGDEDHSNDITSWNAHGTMKWWWWGLNGLWEERRCADNWLNYLGVSKVSSQIDWDAHQPRLPLFSCMRWRMALTLRPRCRNWESWQWWLCSWLIYRRHHLHDEIGNQDGFLLYQNIHCLDWNPSSFMFSCQFIDNSLEHSNLMLDVTTENCQLIYFKDFSLLTTW